MGYYYWRLCSPKNCDCIKVNMIISDQIHWHISCREDVAFTDADYYDVMHVLFHISWRPSRSLQRVGLLQKGYQYQISTVHTMLLQCYHNENDTNGIGTSLLGIHVYIYLFSSICPCRLALYVYEYLLHVGAQKSAQTFLSEVGKSSTTLN